MKVDAIIPAAGRIHGEFAREAGAEVKALISIGGKTVLQRVIGVLRSIDFVGRVVVVGPHEIAEHPVAALADAVLPEGGDSGLANILQGLDWLRKQDGTHAEHVLVLTSDLPMLSKEAVTGFIESCPEGMDICLPIIRREQYEERFPGAPVQYVRLGNEDWSIGCVFLLNPEAILRNRRVIEQVFFARKSPLMMARQLGLMFIIRYLTGRLTVADVERRCLNILGCTGVGVCGCSAELGLDIDLPEEYRYIVSQFARKE